MVTVQRWIQRTALAHFSFHIAVTHSLSFAPGDVQHVESVHTPVAHALDNRSARVAVALSGTMRGFCRCLSSLQHTITNQGQHVKLVLSTYQNLDCGGDLADVELGDGPTVTPENLGRSFLNFGLHVDEQSVTTFVASDLRLPQQHLFKAWHGSLERYYSQFFLRSKAMSLLMSGTGLPEVVILTRPDARLTSEWRFESTDSGWALKVSLPDGQNRKYMLSPTTVVVPASDIHWGLPDDTLVAGRLSAIQSYVSLYDRLKIGAYANAILPSSPDQIPEELLSYHMSTVGLDVKLTYVRNDVLRLEKACDASDDDITCKA